jgi:hypothetical protein
MVNPRGNPNWKKKDEEEPQTDAVKKYYFFSYPTRFQLHHKDEERYHNGDIKQPATVLQFNDNTYVTDNEEIAKHIRSANSFGTTVRECKNMAGIQELKQARALQRAGKMAGVLADDNTTIEEAPIRPVVGTQT